MPLNVAPIKRTIHPRCSDTRCPAVSGAYFQNRNKWPFLADLHKHGGKVSDFSFQRQMLYTQNMPSAFQIYLWCISVDFKQTWFKLDDQHISKISHSQRFCRFCRRNPKLRFVFPHKWMNQLFSVDDEILCYLCLCCLSEPWLPW